MNRDNIKLVQSTLTKSTMQLWRRRNQRRNNAVLDGDDLIEWGQGKKNHFLFKEVDGSTILHFLDYYSCLLRLLLPLTI